MERKSNTGVSRLVWAMTWTLLGVWVGACIEKSSPVGESRSPARVSRSAIFVDGSVASGLDVIHFNGMSGQLLLSEITCGGGGLVDFDNDGDLDVYVSQGQMLGVGKSLEDALMPPPYPEPITDRLYRNDLTIAVDGSRTLVFTDVTESMAVHPARYGCAVAAADYDRDGWVDLFLANLGSNQLLRNLGPNDDGLITFEEVAVESGLAGEGMSTAAAFFDYDGDGFVDLYVGNYATFDNSGATACSSLSGAPDYCGPGAYPSEPDHLYRNRGDGTFEDVSKALGFRALPPQPTLGLAVADFNGDHELDLYIAHDGEPNHLWIHHRDEQGRVRFSEQGLLAGCAVNAGGAPEAGMGVDVADYDDDGDIDIFLAHLIKETNTLYRNDGKAVFVDATAASSLGPASLSRTSFGAAWLDYDNDGRLDLIVANGGVVLDPELVAKADPFPLHMKNQLFHNDGASGDEPIRFSDVSAGSEAFESSEVSRGAAVGDIDNDGDADVLIFNNSGPVRLLINQVGQEQPWLGLRLVDGEPPVDVLHARAAVPAAGRAQYWRHTHTEGSYNVSRDARVLFGLGEMPEIDGVRVVWPDGSAEEWSGLALQQYHTLRRGSGQPITRSPVGELE